MDFSGKPKTLLVGGLKRSALDVVFGLSLLKRIEVGGSSIVLPPGPIAVAVFPFFSSFYEIFLGISCGIYWVSTTGFGADTGNTFREEVADR